MREIKCERHGTLRIVSSGYSDRFVVSDLHLNIIVDGMVLRVDGEADRVPAYLKLIGHDLLNVPDDVFRAAVKSVHGAPIHTWITYKNGNTTHTFETTGAKIEAGIHAALGYVGLNEYGRRRYEPIAATLSSDEWEAIRYGLQRINDEHEKTGKPVVDFSIPEMEA